MVVVAGMHINQLDEPTRSYHKVEQVIMHHSYLDSPDTKANDIALIKVKPAFKFTREISPVCLPYEDVLPGTNCTTTGWGKTLGEWTVRSPCLTNGLKP